MSLFPPQVEQSPFIQNIPIQTRIRRQSLMPRPRVAWRACCFIALLASTGTVEAQSDYATQYVFTTMAGKAPDSGWDDGTGANARFSDPCGITVESNGFLYVADTASQY